MIIAALAVFIASQEAPAPPAPPSVRVHTRLVILDLAANGVDASLVKTISDSIAVTLQKAQIVDDVTSAADLRVMLNVSAERIGAGADCDAKDECMAEVAQALGADVLVHGSVGRLGRLYAVSLSMYDARANRAVARERAESEKLELLSRRVEYATKRLALAFEGKSLELAGAEPDDQKSTSPLVWAGAGVGALGAACGVVGAALAITAFSTLTDPDSSGANKGSAYANQPVFVFTAVGGGVLALAGAGVAVGSLFLE